MKRHDDGSHPNQHDSDRWQAVTGRYLETQAEVLSQEFGPQRGQTNPHVLAKAKVARIELEELKREIAGLKPASD
jgi:hypothetical protein